jgi:hypothetical protein
MKALFLLKRNLTSVVNTPVKCSGLFNSATMTAEELHTHLAIDTVVEVCVDSNEINKYVTLHRPDFAIIEAIWVTKEKLQELLNIHKTVTFIIRIHSEIPFLSCEGMAIERIKDYLPLERTYVAFNSLETSKEMYALLEGNIIYLPNLYNSLDIKTSDTVENYSLYRLSGDFHVGCFGAIRPLKNQLIQALASILFANKYGLTLKFHMNVPRTEQGGEAVLKNIRALFADTPHELVEHAWLDRYDFLKLINSMHIGLQLSFTESFNIVAADFVAMDVAIIVSPTINWLSPQSTAPVDNAFKIVSKIEEVFSSYVNHVRSNKQQLIQYNDNALSAWATLLGDYDF